MEDPVLFENEHWIVTRKGMYSRPAAGGPVDPYFISARRLDEGEWISHMCEKTWVDPLPFVDAYYAAFRLCRGVEFARDVEVLLPNYFEYTIHNAGKEREIRSMLDAAEEHMEIQLGLREDPVPKVKIMVNSEHARLIR